MNSFRIVVQKPNVVTLEPFAPSAPAPTQVLIQTRVSLISPGTEHAFFLALPNTNAVYPIYPGYSNIGTVVAVGEDVNFPHIGDRVASGGPHASHIVMDAAKCVCVPEDLDDESATFFNLIAIAMQGVRKTRIELGEAAVVIGMGPIGLFALQLARANGALPVIAVDLDEHRLALAREVGADAALPNDDSLLDEMRHLCEADGAHRVIEATGALRPFPSRSNSPPHADVYVYLAAHAVSRMVSISIAMYIAKA
jgi:L-iditol 2-dehydrogenase